MKLETNLLCQITCFGDFYGVNVKMTLRLHLCFCHCQRSRCSWNHRGSPPVWRANATSTHTNTTSTSTTRPKTTVSPQFYLPSQAEATVSEPSSYRAAWQKQRAKGSNRQGPDVWGPSCDEDSGGTTKPQGDAHKFVWKVKIKAVYLYFGLFFL